MSGRGRPAARVALLLVLATGGCAGAGADGRPPNVVLLLTDDLRHDTLGFTGYPVDTPAIDRLAAEGVRFENAFVTTSLCSPSRASFLTGVWTSVHGCTGNDSELDHERTPTLAVLLQRAGYRTALVGKWHMGRRSDPRPGYDRWYALPGQGRYTSPRIDVDGELRVVPGYNTDVLTDEAVRWLAGAPEPFFLHVGYKAVHEPRTPAPRHEGRYAEETFAGFLPESAENPQVGIRRRDAECLLAVDESVGRIRSALEERGALDRTLVVFTSDNGYFFGEHGRSDKRTFHEESIRVPWVMRLPAGLEPGAGRVLEPMVLNVDLLPSVLELAGLEVPAHVQGRSFWPVVRRGERIRESFVYEYFRDARFPGFAPMLAVRTERYKLATFPEGADLLQTVSGRDELYDLAADPLETRNVAADPGHAEVAERLAAELERWTARPGFRAFTLDAEAAAARLRELYEGEGRFRRRYDELYPGGFDPERLGPDPAGQGSAPDGR